MIDFNSVKSLKENGFTGFVKLSDLFHNSLPIPDIKGVYMVLYNKPKTIGFLTVGTGGHFKGKNPNVTVEQLNNIWVRDTVVVYIGKAGGGESSATLRSRLRQYIRFGQGKNVGHWGGRYIWQIKDSQDLLLCWKPILESDPRIVEAELIRQFVKVYKMRPFANLTN